MQRDRGLLACLPACQVLLLAFACTCLMDSMETKAVTLDTAIACRPDILQFVPPRYVVWCCEKFLMCWNGNKDGDDVLILQGLRVAQAAVTERWS